MATFFIAPGGGEYSAINVDQVRAVKHDAQNNLVTLIFACDHSIELRGAVALQFLAMTQLAKA